MPVQRIECLEDAAEAIDSSRSWQFLAGRREDDTFSLWAVSKGAIPLVESSVFDGINDCVTVDSEDRETYSKMHVVSYAGDLIGLELFVDYITGDLDGITEGEENPIEEFRERNPLWALFVLGRSRQQ